MNSRPPPRPGRGVLAGLLLAGALSAGGGAAGKGAAPRETGAPGGEGTPSSGCRGVVLLPEDLSLEDWPERARAAGLDTIALHHPTSPSALTAFIESPAGRRFLQRSRRLGLAVEYELHAMAELLPRELFAGRPKLFRMDEAGRRNPDANLCVRSEAALEEVARNARALAGRLRPTTGRYFMWGDDGRAWCCCPRCRSLSDSDQALVLANHLARELRAVDPRATVAHLAYLNTLPPPRARPLDSVFLEFAPIRRRYDLPYAEQTAPADQDRLETLDALLRVFPAATAQVLEYWLDVSRFSGWRRPAVRLPWRPDVVRKDLQAYSARGIRRVTSFAAWIDGDYRRRYGDPEAVGEYGLLLQEVIRR